MSFLSLIKIHTHQPLYSLSLCVRVCERGVSMWWYLLGFVVALIPTLSPSLSLRVYSTHTTNDTHSAAYKQKRTQPPTPRNSNNQSFTKQNAYKTIPSKQTTGLRFVVIHFVATVYDVRPEYFQPLLGSPHFTERPREASRFISFLLWHQCHRWKE